jgi:ATP-dependent Clp protease, protease subunit
MDHQYWIPTVSRGSQFMDVYSAMLADGIIFINAPIDQRLAGLVASSLLTIQSRTGEARPPKIYLNTKRGDIVSAMSVVDIVEHYKKKNISIQTVGLGELGAAASLILCAGTKGQRRAASHAQLSLHVGLDQFDLPNIKSTDMQTRQGERLKSTMIKLLANYSGNDEALFRVRVSSEDFMTAEQAKKEGMVDDII